MLSSHAAKRVVFLEDGTAPAKFRQCAHPRLSMKVASLVGQGFSSPRLFFALVSTCRASPAALGTCPLGSNEPGKGCQFGFTMAFAFGDAPSVTTGLPPGSLQQVVLGSATKASLWPIFYSCQKQETGNQ